MAVTGKPHHRQLGSHALTVVGCHPGHVPTESDEVNMSNTIKAGLLGAILTCMAVQPSHAADIAPQTTFHPYIGVFGGFDFLPGISGTEFFWGSGTLNTKVGDFAGITLGANLSENWRAELELSRSYNGINNFTFNSGSVNTYAGGGINQTYALANVWYDFRNDSALTPYVGGGLGAGWADGNLDLNDGGFIRATSSTALAFQLGIGVTYDVGDKLSLDLGYRFKGMTGLNPVITTSNPVAPTVDQNNIGSHNFQIGLTLKF